MLGVERIPTREMPSEQQERLKMLEFDGGMWETFLGHVPPEGTQLLPSGIPEYYYEEYKNEHGDEKERTLLFNAKLCRPVASQVAYNLNGFWREQFNDIYPHIHCPGGVERPGCLNDVDTGGRASAALDFLQGLPQPSVCPLSQGIFLTKYRTHDEYPLQTFSLIVIRMLHFAKKKLLDFPYIIVHNLKSICIF